MDHERDFGDSKADGNLGPWWCWCLFYGLIIIASILGGLI